VTRKVEFGAPPPHALWSAVAEAGRFRGGAVAAIAIGAVTPRSIRTTTTIESTLYLAIGAFMMLFSFFRNSLALILADNHSAEKT
jgi:hypothetical protein